MDKVKYYKNFSVYYAQTNNCYILKLDTYVNGSMSSTRLIIEPDVFNRIDKLINNYDNDVKEILENGK